MVLRLKANFYFPNVMAYQQGLSNRVHSVTQVCNSKLILCQRLGWCGGGILHHPFLDSGTVLCLNILDSCRNLCFNCFFYKLIIIKNYIIIIKQKIIKTVSILTDIRYLVTWWRYFKQVLFLELSVIPQKEITTNTYNKF